MTCLIMFISFLVEIIKSGIAAILKYDLNLLGWSV